LCLTNDDADINLENNMSYNYRRLLNNKILEFVTQHDLPVFVSIDGSLVENEATVSISIIAPDIRDLNTEETG
jgi:hypothetical protein